MRIRGRNRSGQTLFLTFSVSKASLIVECWEKEDANTASGYCRIAAAKWADATFPK